MVSRAVFPSNYANDNNPECWAGPIIKKARSYHAQNGESIDLRILIGLDKHINMPEVCNIEEMETTQNSGQICPQLSTENLSARLANTNCW